MIGDLSTITAIIKTLFTNRIQETILQFGLILLIALQATLRLITGIFINVKHVQVLCLTEDETHIRVHLLHAAAGNVIRIRPEANVTVIIRPCRLNLHAHIRRIFLTGLFNKVHVATERSTTQDANDGNHHQEFN